MEPIVISHTSALRTIRHARRTYANLPWDRIGRAEQRKVLASCVPNNKSVDFSALERLGIWDSNDGDPVDILVSSPDNRRAHENIRCHVLSKALPIHSLMRIGKDLYCTSPSLTSLLCLGDSSIADALMLLSELLGTYSFSEYGPKPTKQNANAGIEPENKVHYRCEPAITASDLRVLSKWAKSSRYLNYRNAARIALANAASPTESILSCLLASPARYGGFGCSRLPKDGIVLNHRIDFDSEAFAISSGIPYAICDIYVPSSKICLEYNGGDHENAAARAHDAGRNNGLKSMGITVITLNSDQLRDIDALEATARLLYREAGVRFQHRIKGYRIRQITLLNSLRKAAGLRTV